MTDFLQLPNVVTTSVDDQGHRYIIEARAENPAAKTCKLSCAVRKNGTKVRDGVDLRKLHRLLSPSPVTGTVPAGRLSTLEPEFDEVG